MIDIKNIYKYFDKQKVLNGVNCTINKGEKVVIASNGILRRKEI